MNKFGAAVAAFVMSAGMTVGFASPALAHKSECEVSAKAPKKYGATLMRAEGSWFCPVDAHNTGVISVVEIRMLIRRPGPDVTLRIPPSNKVKSGRKVGTNRATVGCVRGEHEFVTVHTVTATGAKGKGKPKEKWSHPATRWC